MSYVCLCLLAKEKPTAIGGLIVVFACAQRGERLLDGLALWWLWQGLQALCQASGEFFLGVPVSETNGNRHAWVGQGFKDLLIQCLCGHGSPPLVNVSTVRG